MKRPQDGRKGVIKMKRLICVVAVILALLLSMASCGAAPEALTKEDAVAVFTIDVNPGIRIYVAEDNTVIEAEATNEDGEAVLKQIDVKSLSYEVVVDSIVDKLGKEGYIDEEESAVLVSVEKQVKEIADELTEKIHGAFEKIGKKASIIKQELDSIEESGRKAAEQIADRHGISEGKAHFIDKIREEFPELDEGELAGLNMKELGVIFDQTSEDIKSHFERVDTAPKTDYITRDEALAAALEALKLTEDEVKMARVHIDREDGRMVYEVKFVLENTEHELVVDALTKEIISHESKEHEDILPDEVVKDFCDKHGIDEDKAKDHFFGVGGEPAANPLTRSKLIKLLFSKLEIDKFKISEIDIRLYEDESGKLFSVSITSGEDVYEIIAEATTGALISAQKNGEDIIFDVGVDGLGKGDKEHHGKGEWQEDGKGHRDNEQDADREGGNTDSESSPNEIIEGGESNNPDNTEGGESTEGVDTDTEAA